MSIRRSLSHTLAGSLSAPEVTLRPSSVVQAASGAPVGFSDHLARVIHDQVLQSLGLALLQAELCRRLWDNGQGEDAATELDGVVQELESAVDELRGIMADLRVTGEAHVRSA